MYKQLKRQIDDKTIIDKNIRELEDRIRYKIQKQLGLHGTCFEDIKILSGILKENNINTRPKVQETIRHYQCLLPRKIISSGQLLAILAFTISVMALLFSEPIMASIGNVQVVLEIILSVIIIYAAIRIIEKNYFRCFGNDELYVRLEASLSEIFMDYYLKDEEKKANQAVVEVN